MHGGHRFRSPFAGLADAEFIAPAWRTCATCSTRRGGDVAALIAEPIQGVGGFTHAPDGLLGAFAKVLGERGILWISDEVQTGWGRTGEHFWGWQAHAQAARPRTSSRSPRASGTACRWAGSSPAPRSWTASRANSISTFGGSPVTAAGALANLRYLLEHDLQGNAAKVGPILLDGLRELDSPIVGDVRGKGLMIGVELVRPGTGSPGEPAPELASAVLEATKRRGLLVGKGGLYGNVLRIAPAADAHPGGGGGGAGRCSRRRSRRRPRVSRRPRPSRRRWSPMSRTLISGGLVVTAADEVRPTC